MKTFFMYLIIGVLTVQLQFDCTGGRHLQEPYVPIQTNESVFTIFCWPAVWIHAFVEPTYCNPK